MTGSGKVVRTKIGKGHLRRNTSQRTKYLLAETIEVNTNGLVKHIKRLAPYMSKRD
jgi:large subunit ribosomal protein L35